MRLDSIELFTFYICNFEVRVLSIWSSFVHSSIVEWNRQSVKKRKWQAWRIKLKKGSRMNSFVLLSKLCEVLLVAVRVTDLNLLQIFVLDGNMDVDQIDISQVDPNFVSAALRNLNVMDAKLKAIMNHSSVASK